MIWIVLITGLIVAAVAAVLINVRERHQIEPRDMASWARSRSVTDKLQSEI